MATTATSSVECPRFGTCDCGGLERNSRLAKRRTRRAFSIGCLVYVTGSASSVQRVGETIDLSVDLGSHDAAQAKL